MDDLYERLGMATGYNRLAAQAGGAAGSTEYQRRLRQIESGADELNLDPAAVHLAAEIAAMEPGLGEQQRLALILLVSASMVALHEGSTRIPVTGPDAEEPMRRILSALCGDAFGEAGADAMAREIAELLASDVAAHVIARTPDEYKPLIYLPPFIYHQRVRAGEVRLAERLRTRLSTAEIAAPAKVSAALADVDRRPSVTGGRALSLSEEQREAVARAAAHRFAVISGGPGTGKTSIVVAILRVMVRLGTKPEEIALAAPTGKAAFRMGECVRAGLGAVREPAAADVALRSACPEPSTVHRMLAYSPARGTFLHHQNNPLAASVIVVDESSMLDLTLMDKLVAALQPRAHLIMLGDADQLPSVAAGAVFRDLVPAARAAGRAENRLAASCARLDRNYRMDEADPAGRRVLSLARAINRGDAGVLESVAEHGRLVERRIRPDDLRFGGVEFLECGEAGIEDFLSQWYDARLRTPEIDALGNEVFALPDGGFEPETCARLGLLFERLAAMRILCVTRVLATGADRVNASLHRRAAQRRGVAAEFIPGEPVMVVRNDYERMLFNGDQGVVLRVRRGPGRETAMAVFAQGGGFAAFHIASLRESIELCYASTIHKAQGSEFDSVAIVIPPKDLAILTRELLYTAASRARKSVVLLGDERLLLGGIARRCERYSGLSDLVAGGSGA
jgi:exodeoxyribonuclease V alpha subunit